jgi:antitoxin VapB
MPLNIKDPEAHKLARALQRETGETMTHAVTEALRERLERIRRRRKAGGDGRADGNQSPLREYSERPSRRSPDAALRRARAAAMIVDTSAVRVIRSSRAS